LVFVLKRIFEDLAGPRLQRGESGRGEIGGNSLRRANKGKGLDLGKWVGVGTSVLHIGCGIINERVAVVVDDWGKSAGKVNFVDPNNALFG